MRVSWANVLMLVGSLFILVSMSNPEKHTPTTIIGIIIYATVIAGVTLYNNARRQ